MTDSDQNEWLLLIDASLIRRIAPALRNKRKRMALSCWDLKIERFLDPALLRFMHMYWPQAVLVTADDHMPETHGHLVDRWSLTLAVIDPVIPHAYRGDDSWGWEIIHRWSHNMQTQPQNTVYRYNARGRTLWKKSRKLKRLAPDAAKTQPSLAVTPNPVIADVGAHERGIQLALEEE